MTWVKGLKHRITSRAGHSPFFSMLAHGSPLNFFHGSLLLKNVFSKFLGLLTTQSLLKNCGLLLLYWLYSNDQILGVQDTQNCELSGTSGIAFSDALDTVEMQIACVRDTGEIKIAGVLETNEMQNAGVRDTRDLQHIHSGKNCRCPGHR